jgi:hypothetical protein
VTPTPPAPPRARRDRTYLILVGLVLLSFGLRLWQLDAKSIWWDESLSLYRARQPLAGILSNQIALPGSVTTDLHPPLYFLLLRGMLRLGGESDLALRFPSVLFVTLLVVMLYVVGARLRNRTAGLLAALCGACSPFLLWYAQEARMYTLVAALGLLAFYALWRALAECKWTWACLFGITAIGAIATQYLFALLVPCALALGLLLWPRWHADPPASDHWTSVPPDMAQERRGLLRRYRATIGVGAAVLLVALGVASVWVAQLLPNLAVGRGYVPLGSILLDALNAFSLGLSVEGLTLWPLLIVFAGVYALGLVSLWRRPPQVRTLERANGERFTRWAGLVMTLGYVVMPVLGIWALSLVVPIYMGSRYLLLCSPGFYLGLGIGLEAAGRRWRWPAWLLGALLVGGMGLSTYRYLALERYAAKEDYASAARIVASCERPGDAIIVTAPENIVAFAHYYQGAMPVIPMPAAALTGNPTPATVAMDLKRAIAPYDRVWLVHCRTMFSDPRDLVTQWLDANTLLLRREILPSYGSDVTLSAYLTRSPLEASRDARARGVFADRLALLDYVLRYQDETGAEHTVTPGETGEAVPPGRVLAVQLRWSALQPLEAYRASLRLVDANGVAWSQNDAEPYMYLPTSQWPVGQVARHATDLRVLPGTPPGPYSVQMWLYRADDGAVLAYRDGQTGAEQPSLTLAEIEVGATPAPSTGEPWPPETARSVPLRTSFARTLQLQGYQLSPESAQPGGTVVLQLYWRALQRNDRDLELVINWQDADGRVWHSTSQPLTGTAYDARLIEPGQLLRSNLMLSVPSDAPAGAQRLHLLLRDHADGRFLWLYRGLLWGASRDLATARVVIE